MVVKVRVSWPHICYSCRGKSNVKTDVSINTFKASLSSKMTTFCNCCVEIWLLTKCSKFEKQLWEPFLFSARLKHDMKHNCYLKNKKMAEAIQAGTHYFYSLSMNLHESCIAKSWRSVIKNNHKIIQTILFTYYWLICVQVLNVLAKFVAGCLLQCEFLYPWKSQNDWKYCRSSMTIIMKTTNILFGVDIVDI